MNRNDSYSGTQIILSSLNPKDFKPNAENPGNFHLTFREDEPHACALCGGTLTEQRFPVFETLSGAWMTSQELEAKDEDMVCAGCKWFLTGKMNRQTFLPVHRFVVFTGEEVHPFTAAQFYDFLKKGFQNPCVIAVMDDMQRTRKHVAWKLNRTISYTSEDVQVALLSIETANGLLDGTARFSASTFLPMVDSVAKLMRHFREQTKDSFKNLWAQYHACIRWFHEEFRKRNYENETLFFLLYFAGNIVFPMEERAKDYKKKVVEPKEAKTA